MSTSWILFWTAVGCGVLFAGCALWAQLRDGTRTRRYRWRDAGLPVAIMAFCTAFGALAFVLDSGNADRTLYEIVTDTTAVEVPFAERHTFTVEHPGARHPILIAVEPAGPAMRDPVRMRIRLAGPDGRTAIDDELVLEAWCAPDCEWDRFSTDVVPAAAGTWDLQITVGTPGVSAIHVWIGDDEKTDGERAPGF
ncbi:hypothetical protein [Pseudonocardia parietis]|uniref:Uncharacterized protein n=1 Tax=Pseudonocardia parietis TaxID=570936 RepID=A0ABS4W2K3_9PSEU|nr:hypothetical protein [Pseudonocardia parietis]MBP2370437.1 hypothetical protein [Pseudonocardia parietis]